MAHEYHTRRRIEFVDTDMAGIVHFSRFYVFMEQAEHELLRSLGLSVHGGVDEDGNILRHSGAAALGIEVPDLSS